MGNCCLLNFWYQLRGLVYGGFAFGKTVHMVYRNLKFAGWSGGGGAIGYVHGAWHGGGWWCVGVYGVGCWTKEIIIIIRL